MGEGYNPPLLQELAGLGCDRCGGRVGAADGVADGVGVVGGRGSLVSSTSESCALN